MKNIIFLIIQFLLFSFNIEAQTKRNRIWTISDSTGIDFTNSSSTVPFSNNVLQVPYGGAYEYASIADSTGNLLFYTDGRRIWGFNNSLCINSDTFACNNCHNSSFFLPSQTYLRCKYIPDCTYIF